MPQKRKDSAKKPVPSRCCCCLLNFNLARPVLISKNARRWEQILVYTCATRRCNLINKRARDFFPIKRFNYGLPQERDISFSLSLSLSLSFFFPFSSSSRWNLVSRVGCARKREECSEGTATNCPTRAWKKKKKKKRKNKADTVQCQSIYYTQCCSRGGLILILATRRSCWQSAWQLNPWQR